jgi:hypothetical protein
MELVCSTRALRMICEDEERAKTSLPAETVVQLQDRLADIDAADSVADLLFGEPELDRRPPGRVRFRLIGGYELVCVNNSRSPALTDEGQVDIDRVRRLKVVKIGRVES